MTVIWRAEQPPSQARLLVELGERVAQDLGEKFTHLTGRVMTYDRPRDDLSLLSERFARGCFTASLARRPVVPLLAWHNRQSVPLGQAVDWDDRPDGLYCRFRLGLTPMAQNAALLARDGHMTGMSCGLRVQRSVWNYSRNWPDEPDKVTRTRCTLEEVSLVPRGALSGCRVTDVQAEPLVPAARSHLRQWQGWRRAYAAMHGI